MLAQALHEYQSFSSPALVLSLIHISEPTRPEPISYAVFCLKKKIYGGIEGGGTKFRCVIGSDPDNIYASSEIDTKTPILTIKELINFFSEKQSEIPQTLKIGIGCFGPLDLDPQSKTYGYVKETPKPGWKNFDIRGELERALKIPVVIDTDVNACLLYTSDAADEL